MQHLLRTRRRSLTYIVEKSAYTDEQLDGYNRYRGIIWRERTLVPESHCEGFEEGKAEGVVEGIEKGREEEKLAIARSLKQMGLDRSGIVKATGLSAEEIAAL